MASSDIKEYYENWFERASSDSRHKKELLDHVIAQRGDVDSLLQALNPPVIQSPHFIFKSGCCGFKELNNLAAQKNPLATFRELFPNKTSTTYGVPAFVFFSQSRLASYPGYFNHEAIRVPNPYGEEFADFLKSKDLGEVVCLGERTNPRTGRLLAAWIWKPDVDKLKKFKDSLDLEDLKMKETWSVKNKATGWQSHQLGQVVGGEQAPQSSGTNGSGIGGGLAETPSGNTPGA